MENLMSVLMDSCAVMRGTKQGVEVRIRKERAPHLLNIDGDMCHHVHNASKKCCDPFDSWAETFFMDIHNEFQWSCVNKDALEEMCFVLGLKYTVPQKFGAHRWLSVYDAAQSALLQWKSLTVYMFAFLSTEDKAIYRSVYDSICQDVSAEGKKRLVEIFAGLKKTQRTEAGKNRTSRLVDKIFHHRKWTKLVLAFYSAVLSVLKEYVCLFQSRDCLVQELHAQQLKLFKRFLAMFVKADRISGMTAEELKNPESLSLDETKNLLVLDDIYVGAKAQRELQAFRASDALKQRFLSTAQSAFIKCGMYLQTKLLINNAVLKAMSVLSPEYKHNSCEAQTYLKSLPDLVNNVLKPLEENEEDEDKILDAYTAQVFDFCKCLDKPSPREPHGDAGPVDEWWGAVNQNGQYDLLYKVVTALLTCFHGPRVESSFSIMSEVLDARANRMAVSTFSAIQTVRYVLQSSGQSAVACFYRKDKLYTPVNKKLCQLMRGARKKHKEEQAAQRDIQEAKRTALSLQKQKLVSEQQAKLKLAEAEKAARITHRRAMRAKLEELSKRKKAEDAASTLKTNCQRSSGKSQSSDSSFKLSSQKADSVHPPSAKRQVSGSVGRSRDNSHALKAKSRTTAGSTKMHTPAPAPATPSTSGNAAHLSPATVQLQSSVPLHQLSRKELFKTLSLKMRQTQTFEELVQICEEYKWCLQKWDVAIASDLDAADYQKDTMACELYPSDGPDLCPLKIYGDGNCLPRCLSLFVCKHEGLHEEMRVRIVFELCLNKAYYCTLGPFSNPDSSTRATSDRQEQHSLAAQYATFSSQWSQGEKLDQQTANLVFERAVFAAVEGGTYMGAWQMHAVASILGAEVFSVYPEYGGHTVRHLLNKKLSPRSKILSSAKSVGIMWTNLEGKNEPPATWKPNHFVVCLPGQQGQSSGSTEGRTVEVGRKRKNNTDIRCFFKKSKLQ